MTSKKGKRKGHVSFAGIPRIVCDHEDYINLGGNAVRLLVELSRQYNGKNNGNLTAAWTCMSKRGFKSKETLSKAIKELVAANLIMITRTGYFQNPGGRCSLYALAWQPIDECLGKNLELKPTVRPPRQFSLERIQ
jgi:hypothetical protein